MATKLEVTEQDIEQWEQENGIPPGYSNPSRVRKQIAREKIYAAISELPGSRYKEILLFMLDEGLV